MKRLEFRRKLKKLAKEKGVLFRFDGSDGKGSHGKLWFGDNRTTMPGGKGELPTGTLRAICRQLGVDPDEL